MFPGGFFAKTYFVGSYWNPNDGGTFLPSDGDIPPLVTRLANFSRMGSR